MQPPSGRPQQQAGPDGAAGGGAGWSLDVVGPAAFRVRAGAMPVRGRPCQPPRRRRGLFWQLLRGPSGAFAVGRSSRHGTAGSGPGGWRGGSSAGRAAGVSIDQRGAARAGREMAGQVLRRGGCVVWRCKHVNRVRVFMGFLFLNIPGQPPRGSLGDPARDRSKRKMTMPKEIPKINVKSNTHLPSFARQK